MTNLEPFIECIEQVAREVARAPEKVVYRARFNEILIEFGDRRLTLDGDMVAACASRLDHEAGMTAFRALVEAEIEALFDPDPVMPPGLTD